MANWTYLPILKWKQGERIALRELRKEQWLGLVPLIELQGVESAPDAASLNAALPPYLVKLGKQLKEAVPEDHAFALDVRYVAPGFSKPGNLVDAICTRLKKLTDRQVIPVLNGVIFETGVEQVERLQGKYDDVILRLDVANSAPSIVKPIVKLAKTALKGTRVHVVIDQFSLVGDEVKTAVARVKPYLDEALASGGGSVTVAGGSFPMNLIGIKQGVHDIVRVEWKVWEQLQKSSDYANLRFSDYAVTNPALAPGLDPTQMNPSVAIRYAAEGSWRLFKAGGFKKGAPNQYQSLCTLLLGDSVYSGPKFSYGDKCYEAAANARLGNGNPSSWRRDATNHHLALTQDALSLA
jgi:hypothetical protein